MSNSVDTFRRGLGRSMFKGYIPCRRCSPFSQSTFYSADLIYLIGVIDWSIIFPCTLAGHPLFTASVLRSNTVGKAAASPLRRYIRLLTRKCYHLAVLLVYCNKIRRLRGWKAAGTSSWFTCHPAGAHSPPHWLLLMPLCRACLPVKGGVVP